MAHPSNTIAFQGAPGANSDMACREVFPEINEIFSGRYPIVMDRLISLLSEGKIEKENKLTLLSAIIAQIGETKRDFKTQETRGLNLIREFSTRHRIPKQQKELTELFFTSRMKIDSVREMTNSEVIAFLERSDAYRRTERFEKMLSVYEICLCAQSGINLEGRANAEYVKKVLSLTKSVSIRELSETSEVSGYALKKALTDKRIENLSEQT